MKNSCSYKSLPLNRFDSKKKFIEVLSILEFLVVSKVLLSYNIVLIKEQPNTPKYDQIYFNTRVPTQVNTNQNESTRVNTIPTRINTSPTRVNTNQHEYDTNQHESSKV